MNKEQINEEIKEEWREYNWYQVSNYGKVINKKGKQLSTKPSKDGYVHTAIKDYNGKWIRGLHRVVATVFLPNPDNLPEVNHIDGKKENNRVDNLEWCTKKENQDHEALKLKQRGGENNYHNKLTNEIVIEIYNLCKEGNMKYKDIGKLYNTEPSAISRIATGADWRHLGLPPLKKIRHGSNRNVKTQIRQSIINGENKDNSITYIMVKNRYSKQVEVIIDAEDLSIISNSEWYINSYDEVVSKITNGSKTPITYLANFILNINKKYKVLYKNNDKLDCRKKNLKVIDV